MISVVIRNKNQEVALEFLLKNLTTRYIDDIDEVIVLDNLSSDRSEIITKSYGAKFVTIKNFSYGGSANVAAEEASNNIVVIFSAHSYPVSHDFFKLIKEKFKNRNDLAGLRCLHSPNDYRNYINKVSSKDDPNKSGLIFSGSAFNKKVWEKHKFNKNVATFEDKEWSKRVIEKGYKIEFVPSIFSYEIKRTKKQQFFRFKNDLTGNYHLWQEQPTLRNAFNLLVASILKLTKSFIIDLYYVLKRFYFIIKFIFNKPKPLKKV
ncbi:glycosyltransferase [Mesoflavibacter sp. CH_XMU1422-2]|uniref:glycosyltransferase n=1 Tax=Mesoflavibacter sp. CH_XMU1422-2 TaxID=3107770 RepID=UPI00300B04F5